MSTSQRQIGDPITKVSDIEIKQVFRVYCDDHGYIDEPVAFSDAIMARREHYFRDHKGQATE